MAAGKAAGCVLCDPEQSRQGLFAHHHVQRLFHQREPVSLAEPKHNGRELRHRTTVYPSPGKGKPCSVVCPGVQGRFPLRRCRRLHLSWHCELCPARRFPPDEHHMEARPTHSGTVPQKDQQTDRGVTYYGRYAGSHHN